MRFDRERVKANVQKADTEDLLDRATVYREQMEPEALFVIEDELRARGVTPAAIDEHARKREEAGLWAPDGRAVRCSFCDRPAVARRWGWHRLWGLLPLFPRLYRACATHQVGPAAGRPTGR